MPCRFSGTFRAVAGVLLVYLFAVVAGCKGDTRSYYEKEKAVQDVGVNFLKDRQAKFTSKHYPKYGSAWLIDMRGLPVEESMLEQLKTVGYIT